MSKEKPRFFRGLKSAWKNIHFVPQSKVWKRFLIVFVVVAFLCLLTVVLDILFGNVFRGLSFIQVESETVKLILSILFLIDVVATVFLITIQKPRTRGWSTFSQSESYWAQNRIQTSDAKMNLIIRILSIVAAVLAIAMFIL